MNCPNCGKHVEPNTVCECQIVDAEPVESASTEQQLIALNKLAAWAATTRKSNTTEWMNELVNKLNACCHAEGLGDCWAYSERDDLIKILSPETPVSFDARKCE